MQPATATGWERTRETTEETGAEREREEERELGPGRRQAAAATGKGLVSLNEVDIARDLC